MTIVVLYYRPEALKTSSSGVKVKENIFGTFHSIMSKKDNFTKSTWNKKEFTSKRDNFTKSTWNKKEIKGKFLKSHGSALFFSISGSKDCSL